MYQVKHGCINLNGIKNLVWWNEALCSGADFPISPGVYHLHPISFLNIISSTKDTNYSEEFKLLVDIADPYLIEAIHSI